MSPRSIPRLAVALMCAALLAVPTAAQDADTERSQVDEQIVHAADLVTVFVRPQFAQAIDLFEVARQLYGRRFFVHERGGRRSADVSNMQYLGGAIVVYDTGANAQVIGEALHALDQQMRPVVKAPDAATKVVAWTPRHISLESAWGAILPRRMETMGPDGRSANMTVLHDLSTILLEDTPERVSELLATLEAIDRPEPQLLVSCWILEGTHEAVTGKPGAPAEIVRDLQALLPYEGFALRSFGLMRTSARAESTHFVLDDKFELTLRPTAFDEQAGQLTTEVRFSGGEQAFDTRTTLDLADDTVLGAAGSTPIFVVLRFSRLGKPEASPAGHSAR